jgi:hypothetical protein
VLGGDGPGQPLCGGWRGGEQRDEQQKGRESSHASSVAGKSPRLVRRYRLDPGAYSQYY